VKVVRISTAESYEPEADWKRISLCTSDEISIEHFVKPARHSSPKHEHVNVQVLVVLEGRIVVTTDADGSVELHAGDVAYIPGNESHVVTNPDDEPCVGLDIFVPGRSFDFWRQRLKQHK
jgi:quercetin dioxygenase-like cupin family protein